LGNNIKNNTNKNIAVLCTFLVIAIWISYSPILGYGFINFDDREYITENPHIKNGLTLESIAWAFKAIYSWNWHPITWLSHILDVEIYGLYPRGHHKTNLILHIANSLLLFGVLFRMTGALWRSTLVATLFALHPLNVESVAWVSERKNVLSTFFWFLTMWAYIRYVENKRIKNYLLVVFVFAVGLMSKSMLVTLPFVLLLLDFWPLKRFAGEFPTLQEVKKIVLEKTPMFLLVIGSSVITYIAQRDGGTGNAVQSVERIPLDARLSNTLVSYIEYLEKMIWPSGLAPFYPHPVHTIPIWKPILFGMLILGFTFLVIKLIRQAPYLAVGWFWYLGTLVPVIGLVQVGTQAMADRYVYVPLVGIFIAIAWGLGDLKKGKKNLLLILTPILAVVLAVLTSHQISYWATPVTLMQHALQVAKDRHSDVFYPHLHLAAAFTLQNRPSEAIKHHKIATKIRPTVPNTYLSLGLIYSEMKEFNQAIFYFKKAIKLQPEWSPLYNNVGNALARIGNPEEAIPYYEKALKIKPNYATAHMNLGNALAQTGELYKAIDHYKESIRLKPDIPQVYLNLVNALASIGNLQEADHYYKIAVKLRSQETIKP
jgi:tetratricopeptide (TPR) repeat protein